MKPTLLDCTLRDGGNQNDWRFTREDAARIVTGLDAGRVDVIEVGYRGGSGSADTSTAGECALSAAAYLRALPRPTHSRLAVMVVPTVCPPQEMDDLVACGIDIVRIAAYPWNIDGVGEHVRRARGLGLTVGVNLMAASYVDEDDLRRAAALVGDLAPDVFYLADSFGALNPDSVAARLTLVREQCDSELGFHGHDNLGLAAANALAALDTGATWIDASLRGMARGAGNLVTERAAALLCSWERFDVGIELAAVCEAGEYVGREVLPEPMPLGVAEIAAGVNDHHYYYVPHIAQASSEHGLDPWEVGRALGRRRPRGVKAAEVGRACDDIAHAGRR
ncbi:MAG: 4-hydroxy 2-oxovalerate aldolase [Solirubrobacteraceae bacterium]|jgi:4-hydroxy 2-oxovalerate aldolase|nr:4-hydroxy 2-oxovalerate aldolase [Solirubrobacteraceae bacterium]